MKLGDDGSNILRDMTKVRVPSWWNDREPNSQRTRTVTELHENRRKDKIPHISYDLDGDGNVGGRDYVLAKLFDKDGDGKLNAEEKAAAYAAIKDGLENKFFWNVE